MVKNLELMEWFLIERSYFTVIGKILVNGDFSLNVRKSTAEGRVSLVVVSTLEQIGGKVLGF